jgi:TIR domain
MSPEAKERRSWYRWLTDVLSPWGSRTATIRLHFLFCDRLASVAYRVVDRLKARYVDHRITTATDIPDGTLEGIDFVFVLIDENWSDCIHSNVPASRLRTQLKHAVASGITVVPMLIGRSEMPQELELGEDLASLVDRNAIRMDPGRSFEDDMTILMDGINSYYRDSLVRWASASSDASLLSRINRFLYKAVPSTAPPEISRTGAWLLLACSTFAGAMGFVGLFLAISEQNYCIILCSLFFLFLFFRLTPFAIREVVARPYFRGEPEIFISYRRADTIGMAGRIYDRLRDRFGVQRVFMDVGGCIPLGADFRHYLDEQVRTSRVVVLLVGLDWVGQRPSGEPRIFGSRDFVRIEVECALASGKPVILVLMDRQTPPVRHELPTSLHPMLDLPCHFVHAGSKFEPDMGQMASKLAMALKRVRPGWFQRWVKPRGMYVGMSWWLRALIAGAAISVAMGLSIWSCPIGWDDVSRENRMWAGAFSLGLALASLWCSGQIVGAVLQRWRGDAKEPDSFFVQEQGDADRRPSFLP